MADIYVAGSGQVASVLIASEESAEEAAASEAEAAASEAVATASAATALTHRNKAEEWAINPEDDPVEVAPDRFSALHWAARAESFAGEAANKFAITASAFDGPFAGGTNIGGAPCRVPWDMPCNVVILDCLTAPLGASWTVKTWHTLAAGGAPTLIATTSVASGALTGRTEDLDVDLFEDDLLSFECTSVGTADTGADGKVQVRGTVGV